MDQPEAVLGSDRALTIGLLANLSAAFLGGVRDEVDAANLLNKLLDRYRSDLSRQLGHQPGDEECHQALEQHIHRLRVSIGEYS